MVAPRGDTVPVRGVPRWIAASPPLISSRAGDAESGVWGCWMGARLTAALLAGRMATGLSRRLGRGGGTVIAGHVVPRIDPTALRTVTRRLRHGTVLVSGTNGKTTTSRLISHILQQGEIQALHNRAGANLVTGLVSAVVAQTTLGGLAPRRRRPLRGGRGDRPGRPARDPPARRPADQHLPRPARPVRRGPLRGRSLGEGDPPPAAGHDAGPERRRSAGRHARPGADGRRDLLRGRGCQRRERRAAARLGRPDLPGLRDGVRLRRPLLRPPGQVRLPGLRAGPPGAVRRGDERHAPGRPGHRGHHPDAPRRDPARR